jgi:hypothetical protein
MPRLALIQRDLELCLSLPNAIEALADLFDPGATGKQRLLHPAGSEREHVEGEPTRMPTHQRLKVVPAIGSLYLQDDRQLALLGAVLLAHPELVEGKASRDVVMDMRGDNEQATRSLSFLMTGKNHAMH